MGVSSWYGIATPHPIPPSQVKERWGGGTRSKEPTCGCASGFWHSSGRCPVKFPVIAFARAARGGRRIDVADHPPRPRRLDPLADHVLRRALGHHAADRPARVQPMRVCPVGRYRPRDSPSARPAPRARTTRGPSEASPRSGRAARPSRRKAGPAPLPIRSSPWRPPRRRGTFPRRNRGPRRGRCRAPRRSRAVARPRRFRSTPPRRPAP